jgi:hypothetical protein
MKRLNTLCGEMESVMIKQVVFVVATVLQRVNLGASSLTRRLVGYGVMKFLFMRVLVVGIHSSVFHP